MKIIVQNLATEYKDEGVGKTLLFLHGWQDNLRTFGAIAPTLVQNYRIVRLDLPGFGRSEMPKEDWNLDKYVHFVADFIKKLNLNVYAILGHSFGGRIAVAGQARNLLKAQKIILINSGGLAQRKNLRIFLLKIITKIGWLVVHLTPLFFWKKDLRVRLYQIIGSKDYPNAGALRNTFLNIIKEDLSPDVQKFYNPTLIIWGEKDQTTPLAEGRRFSELIKNSHLEILSRCGHMAHQDKPEEVAELIKKFL